MADFDEYRWLAKLPEPLRSTLGEILREHERRAEAFIIALAPQLKKCDAEAIVFATLTRMSSGHEDYVHPDLPIAALKLLGQVIALREKLRKLTEAPEA